MITDPTIIKSAGRAYWPIRLATQICTEIERIRGSILSVLLWSEQAMSEYDLVVCGMPPSGPKPSTNYAAQPLTDLASIFFARFPSGTRKGP